MTAAADVTTMSEYPHFGALGVADRLRIVAEEARYRGVPAHLARLLDYLADLLESRRDT